jgi:hypothetical protein
MNLIPKKIFDANKLNEFERRKKMDLNSWQPEWLYCLFSSTTGADLEVTFNFILEDEKEKRQADLESNGNNASKFVGKLKKDIEIEVE